MLYSNLAYFWCKNSHILAKMWRSKQEWRSIGADTVAYIIHTSVFCPVKLQLFHKHDVTATLIPWKIFSYWVLRFYKLNVMKKCCYHKNALSKLFSFMDSNNMFLRPIDKIKKMLQSSHFNGLSPRCTAATCIFMLAFWDQL